MPIPRRLPLALLLTTLLSSCNGGGTTPTPTPAPTPIPAPTLPVVNWSDPATWGGTVPAAGASVTLPEGKRVMLDVSPPALGGLTIPMGSALEFARKDLTLRAEWIMLHGELRIGSEAEPFTNQADLILTDNTPGENVMGMGDRIVAVMDGTLELHGQKKLPWTRLSSTASAGSSTLNLETAPDWTPGSSLTLSSTDFSPEQTEQVVVQRVSGAQVTLATPLKYTHWGQSYSLGGKTLNEKAEVGLLTRNIRIAASEDAAQTGLGANIMLMGKSAAHVQGVELARVGQRNTLRRYPIHFHRLGSAAGSYFSGNSIHDSYNRCVTIHGTDDLQVKDNVTYNNVGHCIFLEDGDEIGNTISGNLVTYVRTPDTDLGEKPILPSDEDAAGYWITNPNNTVTGNVAAGVEGFAFWLAFPEHPTGLGAPDGASIWNRRTPLGTFDHNVAHSGGRGLNVDHGPRPDGTTETTYYSPLTNPADPDSAPVTANFTNFTAYKFRDHGAWLRGENGILSNAILADNAVGVTFASNKSGLRDSLLIGETSNLGQPASWEAKGSGGRSLPRPWDASFPIRGFQFYDGHVSIQNTALAAFKPDAVRQASGVGYLTQNAFSIDPGNNAQGLTWLDDSRRVYLQNPMADKDGDKSATFLDTDGSVTGTPGRTVTASPLLKDAPDCAANADWNASVCQGQYARFWLEDVNGAKIGPVRVRNARGATLDLTGVPDDFDGFYTSLRLNESYTFAPTTATAHYRLGFDNRQPGDTVRISLPYSGTPHIYRDWWIDNRNTLKQVALADLNATTGDSYALEGGVLSLKLVVQNDQEHRDYAELEICAKDLCQ